MNEQRQRLSRTSRWFMGHLYIDHLGFDEAEPQREMLQRLEESTRPRYCKWQLERGQQGNLHYQFFLKVAHPCRRSALFKDLDMVEGEWIEPVSAANVPRVKAYCSKQKTRVAGPWEWSRGEDEDGGSPSARPGSLRAGACSGAQTVVWVPGRNDKLIMKKLLERKREEINMWTKFIKCHMAGAE